MASVKLLIEPPQIADTHSDNSWRHVKVHIQISVDGELIQSITALSWIPGWARLSHLQDMFQHKLMKYFKSIGGYHSKNDSTEEM